MSFRLPGRTPLLALSVALTIGAGLPVVHGPGSKLPPSSHSAPASLSSAGSPALADDARQASTVRAKVPVIASPPMATSTGCATGSDSVREHRDDIGVHPGRDGSGPCRLADPKRVHGPDHRADAVAAGPPPEPAAATPPTETAPRWSGVFNLYRKTAFVTQKDFRWCVAASVQMMVNIVRRRSDRTATTQQRMIQYAQASDHGPWGPGGGTDVTGWIAALRHFGAGRYRAVGTRSAAAALRIAATAMRQTGRPAGMLVMDGRHAWILHGFESRTDPRRDRRARITSVRVSGPLYPIQRKHGYDLRPNTELSVRALARYFQPSDVGALAGRYVVIVPVH